MRWLCIFFPCRWIWHFNADDMQEHDCRGVYQCTRCKTISIGSPRTRAVLHEDNQPTK